MIMISLNHCKATGLHICMDVHAEALAALTTFAVLLMLLLQTDDSARAGSGA